MKQAIGVVLAMLIGCGSSGGDDNGNNGGNNGGGTNPPTGTLQLSADDESGIGPCPTQDVLRSASELAELKTALTSGTFKFLDVPFNGSDPEIYRKKCGIEGFWDPTKNINEVPAPGAITLTMLFNQGNLGICAAGFSGGFGTQEGFPAPGTYRFEFKVTHNSTTWHVRGRAMSSGSSAGATFASQGIDMMTELDDGTLVYSVNGADVADAGLLAAAATALAANGDDAPGFTLDVRLAAGGGKIYTAIVELICVTKST